MSAKSFAWLFGTWLVMASIDSILQGTFTGESNLNVILSLDFIEWKDFLFIPIPTPNLALLSAIWNLATWNFFFFDNTPGIFVRMFTGLLMMSVMVWAVYTQLLPILISVVTATGSLIRSLNPFSS